MTKEQMNEYVSKMLTTDANMFYENCCRTNHEDDAVKVHINGIVRVYDSYGREVAAGLVLWLFRLGMITKDETSLIWNWLAA